MNDTRLFRKRPIPIAAAALCLAIGTAEIAHRLALPQAFMLTALPWGLLTGGAIESGAPLWAVGVAVLVLSAVIAGRLSQQDGAQQS